MTIGKDMGIKDKDYAVSQVPLNERRDLYSTATVYAGYGMSVFNLFLGGTLGAGLTFKDAMIAIIVGNLVVAVIGIFSGYIGLKRGLATTIISRTCFGRTGQVITSALISLLIPGFVGVYTGTVGQMLHKLFPALPWYVGSLIFLASIVATSIYGYKGLAYLSWFAVPLVFILCLYGMGNLGWENLWSYSPSEPLALGTAISMVIAGWITGAVLAGGDVGRYAKSTKDIVVGNLFGWLIAAGALEALGAATAMVAGSGNIVEILISLGIIVPALVLYYLLMWTTADNNLYAFSLAWSNIEEVIRGELRLGKRVWVIIGAIAVMLVGVLVVTMGVQSYIYKFLGYVGEIVPPFGGIIIADYYLLGRLRQSEEEINATTPDVNYVAFASLIGGFLVAHFFQRGIPAIQGMVTAVILYVGISKFFGQIHYTKTEINAKTEITVNSQN